MFNASRLALTCLALPLVVLAGCGSDDKADNDKADTAASGDSSAAETTVAVGGDTGGSSGGGAGSGTGPCSVVTQEQWTALFGDGVQRGPASSGTESCNVLSDGASDGQRVEMYVTTGEFDDVIGSFACADGGITAVAGVGDRAEVDTSCYAVSGLATVAVSVGGEIVVVSANNVSPSDVDAATVAATMGDIAAAVVEAR